MTRRLPIRVVRTAANQIVEASAWWEANRPKAPDAFRQEIERAFELVAVQPHIGAKAGNVKLAAVRRIYLGRIRYHLYYRVKTPPGIVEVLALWHASRGSGPEL
ncbi:MAG: type II toxin-antitoxin system RelE/ParE family toxin [Sedimentisphaerales bacterium]|nr:type II toxin-antitoxin system RelE/ParE family toxin [Sedimentisphaerales bacterium]